MNSHRRTRRSFSPDQSPPRVLGEFYRSSGQELRRRLMCAQRFDWSIAVADDDQSCGRLVSRGLGNRLFAASRIAKQCALLAATNPDARKGARSIWTTKDTIDTKKDPARNFRVIRVFRGSHSYPIRALEWI